MVPRRGYALQMDAHRSTISMHRYVKLRYWRKTIHLTSICSVMPSILKFHRSFSPLSIKKFWFSIYRYSTSMSCDIRYRLFLLPMTQLYPLFLWWYGENLIRAENTLILWLTYLMRKWTVAAMCDYLWRDACYATKLSIMHCWQNSKRNPDFLGLSRCVSSGDVCESSS